METIAQIQVLLDGDDHGKLVENCVGQNSMLSTEVAMRVMGKKNQGIRLKMSFLRRGISTYGQGQKN